MIKKIFQLITLIFLMKPLVQKCTQECLKCAKKILVNSVIF